MANSRSLVAIRYFNPAGEHAFAQVFWIVTFALLTAIGAQIEIPHSPVPYTLQSFFVLLAGALLGKRNGFLSMSAYLGLGILGLPVFSGAGSGVARILGPTGGYLIAFPFVAFVVGLLVSKKRHVIWTIVALIAGLLILFSFGTVQLAYATGMSWEESIVSGFLIFSWWDILKIAAVAGIVQQFPRKRTEL